MGFVLGTTFALSVWIILWADGAKGWIAFCAAVAILLVAATLRVIKPYLPGRE